MSTIRDWRGPRNSGLYELLPELLDAEVLEGLANDPAISMGLFSKAYQDGALSPVYGSRHNRWSPEWEAYAAAHRSTQENTG